MTQINAVNSTGQCPLHYAASKNRFQVRTRGVRGVGGVQLKTGFQVRSHVRRG